MQSEGFRPPVIICPASVNVQNGNPALRGAHANFPFFAVSVPNLPSGYETIVSFFSELQREKKKKNMQ